MNKICDVFTTFNSKFTNTSELIKRLLKFVGIKMDNFNKINVIERVQN
jgi:hypothetical protein